MSSSTKLKPLSNLKAYISSRPPASLFILSLFLLAFGLFGLSIYVKTHEIINPDVKLNWNIWFKRIADAQFCVKAQYDDNRTYERPSDWINVSVVLPLQLSSSVHSLLKSSPEFFLEGNITRAVLERKQGQRVPSSDTSRDNVFAQVLNLPSSDPQAMCLLLTGPRDLIPSYAFPDDDQSCSAKSFTIRNVSSFFIFDPIPVATPPSHNSFPADIPPNNSCRNGSVTHLFEPFQFNPEFSLYLTQEDRAVISLHLFNTMVFLMTMVILLVLYGSFYGYHKVVQSMGKQYPTEA